MDKILHSQYQRQKIARRLFRTIVLIIGCTFIFKSICATWISNRHHPRSWLHTQVETSRDTPVPDAAVPTVSGEPCPTMPELEDILVVMKTGATEAMTKLPIHFSTTLRCIPNFIIFSDFEEDIEGHHLHDTLRDVSPEMKSTIPEFEVYHQLQQSGRDALTPEQLDEWTAVANTNFGRDSLPWKLDKWKFLPMMEQTLQHKADAKWYIFLEADTYLIWSNLIPWLSLYNSSEPYYMGAQTAIGETIFAHGGAGYVLSNPALRKVVDYRKENLKETEEYTMNNWAGDEVLAHTLLQAGVMMHWSFPHVQNHLPGDVDYPDVAYGRRVWCYATIGWHHLTPAEIAEMHAFAQAWDYENSTLRHSDVFQHYIIPLIESMPQRKDWDNQCETESSEEGRPKPSSIDACSAACIRQDDCVQYEFKDGVCYISAVVRLGHRHIQSNSDVPRSHSGWILDRVRRFPSKMDPCNEGPWILPD